MTIVGSIRTGTSCGWSGMLCRLRENVCLYCGQLYFPFMSEPKGA